MGTRHLVQVELDGKTKIAQYGQWDGYPGGQGMTALRFLKTADLEVFKERLRKLEFLTPETDEIGEEIWKTESIQKQALSRDTGAGILQLVYDGGIKYLRDDKEFKQDRIMCEWFYIIDLDEMTLNVNDYKTFDINHLPSEEEFLKAF